MPVFSIIMLIPALLLIALSIKRVPAGQVWIHERFGRYITELKPGIHFLLPFIDGIATKVQTGEWQVGVTLPDGTSADNHPLEIDVDVRYAIRKPADTYYKTSNSPERMLVSIVCARLKAHCMGMPLQEVLREPFMDANILLPITNKDAREYGLEIIDIKIAAVRSPRYS